MHYCTYCTSEQTSGQPMATATRFSYCCICLELCVLIRPVATTDDTDDGPLCLTRRETRRLLVRPLTTVCATVLNLLEVIYLKQKSIHLMNAHDAQNIAYDLTKNH